MKKILVFVFSFLLYIIGFAQEKQNLKVLYVGGSPDFETFGNKDHSQEEIKAGAKIRTASYEKFLNQYFNNVKIIDCSEYRQEMSAGFDVTIFDGWAKSFSPHKVLIGGTFRDDFNPAILNQDFNYPSIFIANCGEFYGRSIGAKTDWLCLCLQGEAYGMNLNHPIFNGPYKVKPTLYENNTPDAALSYRTLYSKKIPDTQTMWKVQAKEPEHGQKIGMVSRPDGFLDSPEAEVISGGVSAKGPDAVAIGRHGNFLHWGFAASPDNMTDEAKLVFANAIVYTAGLKENKIIARKYNCCETTREGIEEYLVKCTKKSYVLTQENDKKTYEAMAKFIGDLKKRIEAGEKVSDQEKAYLNYPLENEETSYEEYLKKSMRDFSNQFNGDADAFLKYIKDNMPYFYKAPFSFVVDEDVKSLKLDNNDKKMLDKVIALWENNYAAAQKGGEKAIQNVEKARRILDRYTLCTFETPSEWRNWYESVKDKLFFTQSGGWYFMVNTTDPSEPANNYTAKAIYKASKQIVLDEIDDKNPVSVGATLAVTPCGEQYVVVKMKIRSGYHTYAKVAKTDPFIATAISLNLPKGYYRRDLVNITTQMADDVLVAPEKAIMPAAKAFNTDGTTVYENEVLFAIPIEGVGEGTIKANVEYQCCDQHICMPPVQLSFNIPAKLKIYSR